MGEARRKKLLAAQQKEQQPPQDKKLKHVAMVEKKNEKGEVTEVSFVPSKYDIGKPHETRRVNGAIIVVRDDLGLSLDPAAWGDPKCQFCLGGGMVRRSRPLDPKQVEQLLKEQPQAKESITFRCPHRVLMDEPCQRCGRAPKTTYVNVDHGTGGVFRTNAACSCVAPRHERARRELLKERGASYSGILPGAQERVEHMTSVLKNAVVNCQHGKDMRKACKACGRKKGQPLNIDFGFGG